MRPTATSKRAIVGLYFLKIPDTPKKPLLSSWHGMSAKKISMPEKDGNTLNIYLAEAFIQTEQIARSRHLQTSEIKAFVQKNILSREINTKEQRVNLVALNLCLDLQSSQQTEQIAPIHPVEHSR